MTKRPNGGIISHRCAFRLDQTRPRTGILNFFNFRHHSSTFAQLGAGVPPPGSAAAQSGSGRSEVRSHHHAESPVGFPLMHMPPEKQNSSRRPSLSFVRPCLKNGNMTKRGGFAARRGRFFAGILDVFQEKSGEYGGKRPAGWAY